LSNSSTDDTAYKATLAVKKQCAVYLSVPNEHELIQFLREQALSQILQKSHTNEYFRKILHLLLLSMRSLQKRFHKEQGKTFAHNI